MAQICLSLGSNIGDRENFIKSAIELLKMKVEIQKISSLYETAPWGKTKQPNFLNICLLGETDLKPAELLEFIHETETHVGRTPSFKWGPREIDIDILFYDHQIINTERLIIPHPHLSERAFVLVPLADIVPKYKHPVLKKTINQLAGEIDTSGINPYNP